MKRLDEDALDPMADDGVLELVEEHGQEQVREWIDGGAATPTGCSEGCYVRPDGICPHGYPSLLLEAGLI